MVYKELHLYSNDAYDPQNPSFNIRQAPFVDRFKVLRCVIPLAYMSTDASNNTLTFTRSGSTKQAVVPAGNYNSTTFPSALEQAINSVSAVADYTVTYDSDANTLTIAAGSPFTINNYQGGTTMYAQIGMTKYSQPQTGSSITFQSPDFTNWSPLILTSPSLVSRDVIIGGDESMNILSVIPIDGPQNSIVSWENTNGGWFETGGFDLSRVEFRLLNAKTLLPITLSQPYLVSIGILTDPDDSSS